MTSPKLSIIIPAYNEARTIRRIVEKIWEVPFPVEYELVVIDDYSHDRTYRIVKLLKDKNLDSRIKILRNEMNRGKGLSIQRGIEVASGDIMVVQDADFEYDPHDIPRLLEPILSGEADVVYGSRFLTAKRPAGMAFPNYVANCFLTSLTNLLYGCQLTDMETCYKLVRMDLIRQIQLKANRFDFEPEITTKIIRRGIPIREFPISYSGRNASEGKKIKARDFFIAFYVLFRNRF